MLDFNTCITFDICWIFNRALEVREIIKCLGRVLGISSC